jgi:endonuclease/exonuclease/phosphatase family metal-dependent hydrolase
MRVLTINLWGRRGAWSNRRRVLIDGLRELQPDLVAFQEAIVTEGYDQVRDILGSGFHLVHQTEREPAAEGVEAGQGISIASRWPIRKVREVDLHLTPGTAGFACAALIAEIEAPDPIGPLLFVNHFPSWEPNQELERELQAVASAQAIDQAMAGRDIHVILAGDLDADPDAGSVRFWTGRQALERTSVCYRDAWESAHRDRQGETFSTRNESMSETDWPFQRIDYIFVRCIPHGGPTLDIRGCELAFDQPVSGVWASDHLGVVADLEARSKG